MFFCYLVFAILEIIFRNKGVTILKAINLLSLLNAKEYLEEIYFNKYIELFGINTNIRPSEIADLKSLVRELQKRKKPIDLNNFFVGFEIRQIAKEFDLLRVGKESVVNIELKRESTEEKITNQLKKNYYYLKVLKLEIYNFTYISSTNKLFFLNDSQLLEEVDFSLLIEILEQQTIKQIGNLHDCFDPSAYLVSPFNSTKRFINDEYFLTVQQNSVKKEIINIDTTNQSAFIRIEGGAGTGKSLLTYDIAKEYIKKSKRVLILHCGKINKGHKRLISDYSWPIEPISNFKEILSFQKCHDYDFSMYDLIIFDEAQRLYKSQLIRFIELTKDIKFKCIFAYDSLQCLTKSEINNKIPEYIEENLDTKKYELNTKIRCNQEINAFVKNLFNLGKSSPYQSYSNISIQYFLSEIDARRYLRVMDEEGWKVIDYTPDIYNTCPYDKYSIDAIEKTHDVIGQEFDNVVAVIDEYFYYNKNELSTRGWRKTPYYHPTKMLYQNVTRARKKLHFVVINNPEVMEEILNILK